MNLRFLIIFAFVFSQIGLISLHAQKPSYTPVIVEASDEAEKLLGSFTIPKGMEVELFAAEPMLANPVCFCIDHQGRFYVAETFRHSQGVTDNRSHKDWVQDDLALQTVEERQLMFEKHLGDQIKDYRIEQERVRQIVDTNGDGIADRSSVFTDQYNHILDGIGAGLLAHRGKVYYTCIPKMWSLTDSNDDGVAEKKEAMFHGFGVRVAFLGHDLHGLCLGPDGRLYFSIGDRGYNVVNKEGKRLKKPYTGAVFRCEPDGRNLEVFAYGLRNPQELTFDDFGNLFTGENNCDSGDKARWVYLLQGSDSGWRMYFQYLSDRGPWNREKRWHLQNDEQPAFLTPPLAHIADGPSGLVYYPGVGLSDRYQGHFFLADFRGSKAISGIRSFGIKSTGASFEVTDQHKFLWNIVGTDVDFDYKGNLYVSDWTDGWDKPGKGRLYRFFDPEEKIKQTKILNSQQLFDEGFEQRSLKNLVFLLQHPDRRIRQEAQFVLVNKNAVSSLEEVAKNSPHQLSRVHAIWGLGQLIRKTKGHSQLIVNLTKDADPEIRAQAARISGDARIQESVGNLISLLSDSNLRVRSLAAISIGQIGNTEAFNSICKMLEENKKNDPFLRHSGVMALLGISKKSPIILKQAAESKKSSVRMAALLVMRRTKSSDISQFLTDPDPSIVLEAARAIHDESIDSELHRVADLGNLILKSDPLARRVLNACYRAGGIQEAKIVAKQAVNSQLSESVRLEALFELKSWNHPEKLDRVDGRWRPVPERNKVNLTHVIGNIFPQLLKESTSIREKAIQLASIYSVRKALPEMLKYATDSKKPSAIRVEALKGLKSLNYKDLKQTVLSLLTGSQSRKKEKNPAVVSECIRILAKLDPVRVFPLLKETIEKKRSAIEKQNAVHVLASMNSKVADQFLVDLLKSSAQQNTHPEILLDLLEIGRKKNSPSFNYLVSQYENSPKRKTPSGAFHETLIGGNRDRGNQIFFERTAASCRRCHLVNKRGGRVGPDLTHIAKEKTREYLLEAIIAPELKIAKGFETITVAMDDGKLISGILKSETDKEIVISQGGLNGKTIKINKEDIDDRTEGKSGMPLNLGKVLSKRDIRDLVEYLSTLK